MYLLGREQEQEMKSKVKKTSKKCSVCVGHICVHERGETMTEKQQTIPNIAEQTMDMLEKLLKERENNPKEILRLASRNDLVIVFVLKKGEFYNQNLLF